MDTWFHQNYFYGRYYEQKSRYSVFWEKFITKKYLEVFEKFYSYEY